MEVRHYPIAIASLCLVGGCVTAPADRGSSDQALLVGAWTLVSATQERLSGGTRPSRIVEGSEHATGSLVYSFDGTVSVQIAGQPRPAFARGAESPSPAPAVGTALLSTYYAYFGRYEIDPANRKVRHFVTTSLFSGENGRTYERRYRIDGDLLTLETTPALIDGESVFNRLVWRRVHEPVSTSR